MTLGLKVDGTGEALGVVGQDAMLGVLAANGLSITRPGLVFGVATSSIFTGWGLQLWAGDIAAAAC